MTPLPPKQGLKQGFSLTMQSVAKGYDTTSTKTRIETTANHPPDTRQCRVMTPLPPKQGLKPGWQKLPGK